TVISASATCARHPSFDNPTRQRKDLRMRTWIISLWLCATSWFVLPCPPTAQASEARETPLVRAVRRAQAAVVNIHSERTARDRDPSFEGTPGRKVNGMGTGIVIDERG